MPQGKGTYGSKKGRPPKKMRYGGETRPMGSDPKPMIPERPRPMPQESRVRVRPGMKGGGTVAMPKMMARGGKAAKAERKALGVGSVGKEVMRKLGLGAVAGPAAIAVAKGVKSLLKGKPTATRAQLKSLTKKKK